MKSLVFSFFLMTGVVQAEVLKVKVADFNFSYEDPNGEGTATSFSRNQFIDSQVQVNVSKVNKDFQVIVTGSENHEFDLKNAPDFITNAETMDIHGLNLLLDQSLDLSLKSARFNSKKSSLKLDLFSLFCLRDVNQDKLLDQIVTGCTQKLSLKSSKFISEKTTELIAKLIGALDSGLGVHNVDLQINNGKFDLTAEVKADISGRVRGRGTVTYDPSTGKITARIDEVKFGILNITGRVLDEIKKKENEKLKVKGSTIYYSLK
jgi:hypothetical protein